MDAAQKETPCPSTALLTVPSPLSCPPQRDDLPPQLLFRGADGLDRPRHTEGGLWRLAVGRGCVRRKAAWGAQGSAEGARQGSRAATQLSSALPLLPTVEGCSLQPGAAAARGMPFSRSPVHTRALPSSSPLACPRPPTPHTGLAVHRGQAHQWRGVRAAAGDVRAGDGGRLGGGHPGRHPAGCPALCLQVGVGACSAGRHEVEGRMRQAGPVCAEHGACRAVPDHLLPRLAPLCSEQHPLPRMMQSLPTTPAVIHASP